ncbi:MAG: InlB B-repeat-containing protein [Clostridia bacterium]|nr:InlB B-repeat-containing protein [Clostridia bacterium]
MIKRLFCLLLTLMLLCMGAVCLAEDETTYTVVLDPNIGTGETYTYVKNKGDWFTLPDGSAENPFPFTAPEGKMIWSWVMLGDGSDAEPGFGIHGSGTLVLRAQWINEAWEENTYAIKLVVGSWTEETKSPVDADFVLPDLGMLPCRNDYEDGAWIDYWTVNGVKYPPCARLEITGDVTATATLGSEDTTVYKFVFNANGGIGNRRPLEVSEGTTIVLPENPYIAPAGKMFKEWDLDGVTYQPGDVIVVSSAMMNGDRAMLNAVWKGEEHLVTFDANGGEGTMAPQTFEEGVENALKDNEFTREGYTFAGWNTKADGSGDAFAANAPMVIFENQMLFAQWQVESRTFTLAPGEGNGDVKDTETHDYGYTFELPGAGVVGYAKEGYDLVGWHDGTKTYQVGESYTLTDNVTLTAQWQIKTYSVTLDLSGMMATYPPVMIEHGQTYTLPHPSEFDIPENLEFRGWRIGEQNYGPNQQITVTSDITVVMKLEVRKVKLTYLDDNGNVLREISDLLYAAAHTELTPQELGLTAPEGYEFNCWMLLNTRGGIIGEAYVGDDEPLMVFSNWMLKPNWVKKSVLYTLTLDMNGGNAVNGIEVYEGAYFELPPMSKISHPAGLEFDYFDIGDGNQYGPSDFFPATGNVTAVAHWKGEQDLVKYTITFDANGGMGSMDAVTAAAGSSYTLPACGFQTPINNEFKAWNVNGVEYNIGDIITVTGDVTVKPVWKWIEYTVSFDAQGGTGTMDPVSVLAGTIFTAPECAFGAPQGMSFEGWHVDDEFSAGHYRTGDDIYVYSDITLKAGWTQSSCKIIYKSSDAPDAQIYEVAIVAGSAHTLLENMFAAPEGQAFKCWLFPVPPTFEEVEELEPGSEFSRVNADLTFVAAWETVDNTAEVSFDANGGTGTMDSVIVQTGSTYYLPWCEFEREGHNFIGWLVNGEGEPLEAYETITVNADTKLVAKWEARAYNMMFSPGIGVENDDEHGELVEKRHGETFAMPQASDYGFSCEGHVFSGWRDETNGPDDSAKIYKAGEMFTPTAFTIFVAQWDKLEYTVTFNAGEGTGTMADDIVKWNETCSLPECTFTAPEGYEFKAWLVNGNEYPVETDIFVTQDMTVTALWQIKTYTVNYELGDGMGSVPSVEVTHGQTITLPEPNEVDESKAFDGWMIGESKRWPGQTITVTSDMTIVAKWRLRDVRITYENDAGETLLVDDTLIYGGVHTVLTLDELNAKLAEGQKLTAPEGYEFDGWLLLNTANGVIDELNERDMLPVYSIWKIRANWVKKSVTYTLTLDMNGGDAINAIKVYEGEYFELPAMEKISHPDDLEFDYFDIGDGNKYAPGDRFLATGNVTAVAHWKEAAPVIYTITFDADGGMGSMDAVTVEAGSSYTLPACGFQTPINNEFKAWNVNGAEYNIGDTITVTGDVTVKPVWKWIEYTVTFDAQGGTGTMEPVKVLAGTDFTVPICEFEAPEFMLFSAWVVDDELSAGRYNAGDVITVFGDITLKAGWAKSERKITYKSSDEPDAQIYEVAINGGDAHTLLNNMFTAPEGKIFRCWLFPVPPMFTEVEEHDPGAEFTRVNADLTFIAAWETMNYTVSFDGNGGSGSMDMLVMEHGSELAVPECEFNAPAGMRFDGWAIDGEYELAGDTLIIKGSVKLTAQWAPVTLAVSFEAGEYGSGTMATEEAQYGIAYALPQCGFSYDSANIVFIGWNLNGTYYSPYETVILKEDTTFTAMWADRWYTFSYVDSYDNTLKGTERVEYGHKLTLPKPEQIGFTAEKYHRFAYWSVGGKAYQPGDTIGYGGTRTIKAMWEFDESQVETKVEETPVEIKPQMTQQEISQVVTEVFSEQVVEKLLKALPPEITEPAQIVDVIEEAVPAGYDVDTMTLQNVELMFKPENSDEWIKATKENFPTAGVTHTLAFNEGTSPATHDYTILHMLVEGKVGEIEYIRPERIDENGVTGRFYSLSPVSLVAKEKPVEDIVPDDELAALPETGDPSSLFGWLTLLGASGMSLKAIKRRKK